MARGIHTTIEDLSYRLRQRWIPKWYEAFSDHDLGGFYERLDTKFKPLFTGQRRLITQCRQLSVYSHASKQGVPRDFSGLQDHFEFITRTYHIPDTGGWIFSVNDQGQPLDTNYDLYALSFVIFSMAHYYQAFGDERAQQYAKQALIFITTKFRMPDHPGFAEMLDAGLNNLNGIRRHESHMHLLEACLFAAHIFSEDSYLKTADEIIALFMTYFYDSDLNLLSEYYTEALQPLARDDHIVAEPGHYCEWIWLLKKQAQMKNYKNTYYDDLCRPMLEWASVKGWDERYGGIYDELDLSGIVIADTKRLWPLSEALKANALMLDSEHIDKKEIKNRIQKMVAVFRDYYMAERGFWTEWLARDLSVETDYMPGTSPYHVYFGIMETRDVLYQRGKSCSWFIGFYTGYYKIRRKISDIVRMIRLSLKTRWLYKRKNS